MILFMIRTGSITIKLTNIVISKIYLFENFRIEEPYIIEISKSRHKKMSRFIKPAHSKSLKLKNSLIYRFLLLLFLQL